MKYLFIVLLFFSFSCKNPEWVRACSPLWKIESKIEEISKGKHGSEYIHRKIFISRGKEFKRIKGSWYATIEPIWYSAKEGDSIKMCNDGYELIKTIPE